MTIPEGGLLRKELISSRDNSGYQAKKRLSMSRETSQRPIRLVYVEDDKDIRLPISQILTILGYEVICANNGRQGIEATQNWKPDIILMDLRMPVMDGPTAIRTLRSNPDTSDIPIFVLSAYSDAKTRDECRQIGVDRFMSKPIDIEKLDTAIKETLNRQTQEKSSRLRDPLHDLLQGVA
jgi:CheY-like chemotaxis protein